MDTNPGSVDIEKLINELLGEESEGPEITIEVFGVSESLAGDLRQDFDQDDEDVAFANSFGGLDLATIFTKLKGISKFIDFARKHLANNPKTVVKIEKKSFELSGFDSDSVLKLLGSSEFKDALQTVQKNGKG